MAAQQGLFTQLPSVDDLLQQRNKRATDLQQQLMANAAQGARDPAKAQAISFLGSSLGRALGGAMGGEDEVMAKRKADIAQQTEMQGKFGQAFTQGTPEHQLKLANELIQMGYVEKGTELFEVGQAGLKEAQAKKAADKKAAELQRLRDNVAATAEAQGLTQLAATVRNGGDLGEAQETLAEYEQTQIVAKGGRAGRVQLAAQYSKGQPFVDQINSGAFDKMSGVEFIALLKGKQANNKAYKGSGGITKIYSEDEQGKVLDPASETWVYPHELGLSVAPKLTQEVIPILDTITRETMSALVGAEVKNYADLNQKANSAVNGIYINDQSMDIFDQGIILGKFGEMRLQIAKGLEALGLSSEQATEATANTEAYLAYRGNAVANIIQAFGAGTGLSDQDRKYATAMAGGQIEMTPLAVKRILEIERKGYVNLIKENNKVVDRLIGRIKGTDTEKAEMALSYYIAEPADRLIGKTEQQSVVDKWLQRASIRLSTRQLGVQ